MLGEVKLSLRIVDNDFDNEIEGLIAAAKSDLETSGVASSNINNDLCKQAIILYCKANFGLDNPNMDKYITAYEHIKKKISITLRDPKESESDN